MKYPVDNRKKYKQKKLKNAVGHDFVKILRKTHLKVNHVIYSPSNQWVISISNVKTLFQVLFETSADKLKMFKITKGHNFVEILWNSYKSWSRNAHIIPTKFQGTYSLRLIEGLFSCQNSSTVS